MSEYQYYEFLTVGRVLTREQMREVREWSTRAEITPRRFVNEYQWGDFKGDPVEFMVKFYDVHVYWANWGTRCLMLGLDEGVVDKRTVKAACGKENVKVKKGRMVLGVCSEDEERSEEEMGGGGWGAMGVRVHGELEAGDLRGLYLMWLARVQMGDVREDEEEPVDATGIGVLTDAQEELADFLRLDFRLLRAAQRGRGGGKRVDEKAWRKWVAGLKEAEKDGVICEVVGSQSVAGAMALWRRFERETAGESAVEVRRAGELMREAGM